MRIPERNPKQFYIDKPIFQGQKNGLITCTACRWDFAGPRDTLKHAWNEHWKFNHSEQVVAMLIDKPERPQIIIAR